MATETPATTTGKPDEGASSKEESAASQPPKSETGPSDTTQGTDAPGDAASGSVDDYLGSGAPTEQAPSSPPPEEVTYEKRYRDSSREATKFKQRSEAYERFLNAHPELAAQYSDELAGLLEHEPQSQPQPSVTADPALLNRIEHLERRERQAMIAAFEHGKTMTTALRKQMQPVVQRLVKSAPGIAPMPFDQALEVAWASVNNPGGTSPKAEAETYLGRTAAYVPSGGGAAPEKTTDSLPSLTPREYEYAKKIGAIDENGKPREKFLEQLKAVRS